ncbi:EthD family reductase [Cupriavidus sp. 2SB]|uniref:EthD family reductase n=1 Tax=Cupriavidus sp. 2SB TaxID=2502199 RepID=UPI0010F4C66A|nr:EthD family reductase [Cupriavidus sp. 2SB]
MAKLVVLYKKPADKDAFDSYYLSKHVPIAKRIPGLRSYEISTGPVASPAGDSPFHLVALLGFDSLEAIQQGMSSSEGAAAAADLGNFAQAGADLLIFDTKEV